MTDAYEPYATTRAAMLSPKGVLHAVLAYTVDFISRGDIDVGFTLSGGAIAPDGRSADPAVWPDWVAAWRSIAESSDASTTGQSADDQGSVSVQHGFRALHVFLVRNYEPIHETPMSRVRADCEAVFSQAPCGAAVWNNWLEAVTAGESADFTFRLTRRADE